MIIYQPPIANYMQEVGRAGRDGKQSIASILYMQFDVEQAYFVAMQDFPDEQDIILAYQPMKISAVI